MKHLRLTSYGISALIFIFMFIAAMCEAPTEHGSPCDTLQIISGKAQQIAVSRNGKFLAHYISVQDSAGNILALKSKDGWQIVDCEGALEVLIADLELARQKK